MTKSEKKPLCEKHITYNTDFERYCIYCLIDDGTICKSGIGKISEVINSLLYVGYTDYQRGIYFVQSAKYQVSADCTPDEADTIRRSYQKGQFLAKSGMPIETFKLFLQV